MTAHQDLLPLTPAAFHLLLALVAGDRHGWAIKKEVERLTEGRVRLGTGTLYGLIRRLLEQELIAESDRRPPLEWDDERRRYYRITELGRRVVAAESERMERALGVARRLSLVPGSGSA